MNHDHREKINAVLERYKAGVATSDDLVLLESWYVQYKAEGLEELTVSEIEERVAMVRLNLPVNDLAPLHDIALISETNTSYLWPRIAVAAAVLFILSVGLYFIDSKFVEQDFKEAAMVAGITPGRNSAILKLADGSEISLSDAANGKLAEQAGVSVTKTKDGQLLYAASDSNSAADGLKSNAISTPKGGQWQVRLPDGSMVWLNAATTLTYPITFKGQKNRRVELNGEAYFEVAKDKTHPFVVHSVKQDVEVLGTHFNINTYENEPAVKTTLLEGAVKVGTTANGIGGPAEILKPGQQSSLSNDQFKVTETNVQMAIDWKNNEFRFKNESLSSILRKVSRWYDVTIIYGDKKQAMPTFSGSVSRSEDVSSILKMLQEASDVHFEIEGKTIRVK